MSSTSNNALAVATSNFGIFLPPNIAPPNASYAVSIVNLCNPLNTYAIKCISAATSSATAGPYGNCGVDAPVLTITEDLTDFTFAAETSTLGTSMSVSQTCSITGGYSAVCIATYDISAHGTKTQSTVTNAFTNGNEVDAQIFPVKFTGGVSKFTNATLNTCSAAGMAAKPLGTFFTGLIIACGLIATLTI